MIYCSTIVFSIKSKFFFVLRERVQNSLTKMTKVDDGWMIFTQNPLLFLWVWKLLIVSFTSVYWRHDGGKNVIVTFLEYT